ncbi:hypothetical protein LDENG_00217430 [Lucifuga dentata]|nr:hypothetical protein LDENG_00217430 [Lucifuga dentata]
MLYLVKGPYRLFCMFEPDIFNFHTFTDNHFPKHTTGMVTLLTIISQRIKSYFSFPDILQNLLIFQNQIFKQYTHLKNPCLAC